MKYNTFQTRVTAWVIHCFGLEISNDKVERNHRFLEEALELVQSCDCTVSEAHQLVDYVYNRPIGHKFQEAGGVALTFAALCSAQNIDLAECAEAELIRVSDPKVSLSIREKQKNKPSNSPLPEDTDKEVKNGTRNYNVGNSDYASKSIQPWQIWIEYALNPWDGDILKRLLRNKDEEGMTANEQRILDYQKIKHICDERIDQINDGDPWYKNLKQWLSKNESN